LSTSLLFAAPPVREVRSRAVVVEGAMPADLVSPEGKSRWQLESAALGPVSSISVTRDGATLAVDARTGASSSRLSYSGPDAERWLLPDHDPSQMKMGARVTLDLTETRDGLADRLQARIATVGIGWVHLPSGPEEVVLERVLVLRQRAGERAMRPDVLVHRFVSPRKGVLASITGPVTQDGRSRLGVTEAMVVDAVLTGAADLKVYADQLYRGNFTDIKYGYDRGPGVAPSALVPDTGINNVCDLVNLSTWNFSGVNSGNQTATTEVASVPTESCNTARCGYQGYPVTGGLHAPILERLDRNLTGTLRKDNQVVQREDRATDVTFWLRAGAQNENKTGFFGSGESRFCFTNEGSVSKNPVPIWQMAHNDAGGWYTQAGDTWSSVPPAACQETFYTLVCGASQPLTPNPLYGKACTNSGQSYPGTQSGKVVKGGVVILPSGHTLNALVVRNATEFCVYGDSACGTLFDRVRTIVYYWQVPFLGSVALVRGPRNVNFAAGETGETPCTNFTSLDFTDMGYGLYPPVSISTGAVTDTSIALSWNPGNDTHRINGYRIYWDTDPGASSNYAFNSVANAGQVSIVGTTATISGLTPGTPYYFTVTTLSSFTDPSSSVTTAYESIRYPTTVSGDPSFSYPVEVTATTTGGACIPQAEITGLTADKSLPNVHLCWNATADACALGYDVLASDNASNDVSWTVVGQVGLTTCWDGDPGHAYLLVRARGTGGNGPWGHYNH
jgi:hypothetical protein